MEEKNADPGNHPLVVLIDSSYLVAISSQDDASHRQAQNLALRVVSSNIVLILPGEVFSETINTLWRKVNKATAIKAVKVILSSSYSLPQTTDAIRLSALEKFEKQPNSVSFTDCLVMAFADSFKTKTILGFDEAFVKSGYSLPQVQRK